MSLPEMDERSAEHLLYVDATLSEMAQLAARGRAAYDADSNPAELGIADGRVEVERSIQVGHADGHHEGLHADSPVRRTR
jgi:hypothetical protein